MGLISGMAFGLTSPLIGHPFDTIKTNMQVKEAYRNKGMVAVGLDIVKSGGIRSLFSGLVPPLIASTIFRGVQFSAYSAAFSAAELTEIGKTPIPFTGGLRPSVFFGAFAGALARASIESPFDYVKVRRQTGQSFWLSANMTFRSLLSPQVAMRQVLHCYTGFGATFLRTWGLFSCFFCLVDLSVRHINEIITAPAYGPFFKGSCCATVAWGFAFPFEVAKSKIQGVNASCSTSKVLSDIVARDGVKGLYQGFSAGATRSFFANGLSMVVYGKLQEKMRK